MANHLKITDRLFHLQREKREPINVNEQHAQALSLQDKIALSVTSAIGTMYAVYFFAVFMSAWMVYQIIIDKPFDPYPFAFLLFIGNIVQLLLMPLIMVGQNIQSRHSELRAEEQFKTTQASLKDVEAIMDHLDAQDKELLHQTQLIKDLVATLKPDSPHL